MSLWFIKLHEDYPEDLTNNSGPFSFSIPPFDLLAAPHHAFLSAGNSSLQENYTTTFCNVQGEILSLDKHIFLHIVGFS